MPDNKLDDRGNPYQEIQLREVLEMLACLQQQQAQGFANVQKQLAEIVSLENATLSKISTFHWVTGGSFAQVPTKQGDGFMNPIQPGNTVSFKVTPTFSGPAFALDPTKCSVTSSDPANFPAAIDLTLDPSGASFTAVIPADAQPTGGDESISVEWDYANPDGTIGKVTGTVSELGIVDDVTGGTFEQVV